MSASSDAFTSFRARGSDLLSLANPLNQEQDMNTPHIALALAAASAIAIPHLGNAAVPKVDSVGQAAQIRCGSTAAGKVVNAAHADKIVFEILGFLQAQLGADQPDLNGVPRNTELDIKVIDDPTTVADIKGKVLTFLGALDIQPNRDALRIVEVKYAMVCKTTAAP
jgi:hypothetical protein